MRWAGKAAGLSILLAVAGLTYVAYKLDHARQDLEWYKSTYGYTTQTSGLPDCVLDSPTWKGILIDSAIESTDGAHNIRPFDIDGDNDLELVANSYRSDCLMMYDCSGDPRSPHGWRKRMIDSSVGDGLPGRSGCACIKAMARRLLVGSQTEGAHYTATGDLSGDGRSDLVVAGDLTRNDVIWYEAVPDARGRTWTWEKHVVYRNDAHRTYHVETGDIDGDGDLDIVFATKTNNSIGWLENPGASAAWPATLIDPACTRGFYARVADIDRNGKAEILASQDDTERGGRMCLYTCAGRPREPQDWHQYDIVHLLPGHGISVFTLVDLDGDGDSDIAAANHEGDVLVLRNPWPQEVRHPWEVRFVARSDPGDTRNFREIDVGDIDLDGNPDIIAADEGTNAIRWYANPGDAFQEDWPSHVVDQSNVYLRWCHSVRLGDVDKDGDLDVAVAAAASNVFLLYLNQMPPRSGSPTIASHPEAGGQHQ